MTELHFKRWFLEMWTTKPEAGKSLLNNKYVHGPSSVTLCGTAGGPGPCNKGGGAPMAAPVKASKK